MPTKLEVRPPASEVSGQRGNMPGYATDGYHDQYLYMSIYVNVQVVLLGLASRLHWKQVEHL